MENLWRIFETYRSFLLTDGLRSLTVAALLMCAALRYRPGLADFNWSSIGRRMVPESTVTPVREMA